MALGMIVTIDGPAGAGKSSAARALAKRLGFDFLDTGAMYRAVALAAQRRGVSLDDEAGLAQLLASVELAMPPGGMVILNGEDVSAAIRSPEVTAGSSPVAASRVVRLRLVQLQRELALGRNLVSEGRDQGTVVFPDALCKFFLTADAEERARRRQAEMAARGERAELDAVQGAQAARDLRDAQRELAPMRPADDAIVLDTTGLGFADVVDRLFAEVQRRLGAR